MYDFVLAANVVVFLAVSAIFLRSPVSSVFHPGTVYLAFHGILFVFRPLLSRYYGYRFIYELYRFEPSLSDKVTVILAANLGFLCFMYASMRTGNAPMRFRRNPASEVQRNLLFKPLVIALGITLPIGIASLVATWYSRTAGTGSMVSDAATGIAINTDRNGYFVEAQLMLVTISVLFAWMFRFRWWAVMPVFAFVFFRAGTGGRGPFVVALASLLLSYMYKRGWKWPPIRAMLWTIPAVMLFNLIGADRGQGIRELVDEKSVERRYLGEDASHIAPLEGMDLGNLEYFEYLVYAVPQRTGTYEYFVDQLQIFTEPIPRVLWKDKPIGSPIQFFSLFDYGSPVGMTRSMPGEGWVQLGYAGVAFWCGLWGLVLGWVYNKFVVSSQGIFQAACYMLFLPIMIIAYRDGVPITVLRQGIFFFSPIVIWWIVSRLMTIPSHEVIEMVLKVRKARAWRGRPDQPAAQAEDGAAVEAVPRSQRRKPMGATRSQRMRMKLQGAPSRG